MRSYIYSVADLNFKLTIPVSLDVDKLLPSMRGFRVEECQGEMIFQACCVDRIDLDCSEPTQILEQTVNDMGNVCVARRGDTYIVSISYVNSQYTHYLYFVDGFSKIELQMQWQDKLVGHSLNSLLRIAFAQAVIPHGGVSIHGSTVIYDSRAYLFLGKSGTGKSTHSSLWMKEFDGCELLNDDNPTIRVVGDEVNIYGTPWSGKTPCYKNKSCRLQGIVRLQQAPENEFRILQGIEAFVALLPGCAVLRFDNLLYDKACDTLSQISERAIVGQLRCLPNSAAAILCCESLKNKINN